MFKKRNLLAAIMSIVLVCSIFALTGCSSGTDTESGDSSASTETTTDTTKDEPAEVVELKFGTKMTPESLEGQGFQKFADLVAEKTNGSVEVIVYPSEQLGDSGTQVDNLILGSQDIYAEGMSYFKSYAPELTIESIPYLFTGYEDYQRFLDSGYEDTVVANLEANGLVLLDESRAFLRGPYRVLCSTYPINSLEDLQGLRMRTHDNAQYMQAYNELGANPLVISWTETYLAIKQGTVDAVASPISLVYDMSFTEVAPYVAIIDEYPQNVGFVMNKAKFDSLTEEQQTALREACYEAGVWETEQINAAVAELEQKMVDEHGAVFTEIDTQPFKDKLKDFYLNMAGETNFGSVDFAALVNGEY